MSLWLSAERTTRSGANASPSRIPVSREKKTGCRLKSSPRTSGTVEYRRTPSASMT